MDITIVTAVENNPRRPEFQGIGARTNGFLLIISLLGTYKFYKFALTSQSTPVLQPILLPNCWEIGMFADVGPFIWLQGSV